MKISISFQNFDHTETLDTKIKEKSEKLNKYVGPSGHIHWHCYVKENKHYAEIKFGNTHAKANSESLYKTIDMVLKKAEKQLVKQNGIPILNASYYVLVSKNLRRRNKEPLLRVSHDSQA